MNFTVSIPNHLLPRNLFNSLLKAKSKSGDYNSRNIRLLLSFCLVITQYKQTNCAKEEGHNKFLDDCKSPPKIHKLGLVVTWEYNAKVALDVSLLLSNCDLDSDGGRLNFDGDSIPNIYRHGDIKYKKKLQAVEMSRVVIDNFGHKTTYLQTVVIKTVDANEGHYIVDPVQGGYPRNVLRDNMVAYLRNTTGNSSATIHLLPDDSSSSPMARILAFLARKKTWKDISTEAFQLQDTYAYQPTDGNGMKGYVYHVIQEPIIGINPVSLEKILYQDFTPYVAFLINDAQEVHENQVTMFEYSSLADDNIKTFRFPRVPKWSRPLFTFVEPDAASKVLGALSKLPTFLFPEDVNILQMNDSAPAMIRMHENLLFCQICKTNYDAYFYIRFYQHPLAPEEKIFNVGEVTNRELSYHASRARNKEFIIWSKPSGETGLHSKEILAEVKQHSAYKQSASSSEGFSVSKLLNGIGPSSGERLKLIFEEIGEPANGAFQHFYGYQLKDTALYRPLFLIVAHICSGTTAQMQVSHFCNSRSSIESVRRGDLLKQNIVDEKMEITWRAVVPSDFDGEGRLKMKGVELNANSPYFRNKVFAAFNSASKKNLESFRSVPKELGLVGKETIFAIFKVYDDEHKFISKKYFSVDVLKQNFSIGTDIISSLEQIRDVVNNKHGFSPVVVTL